MEVSNELHPRQPVVVSDKETGTSYILSELLGKGAFAKCYLSKEIGTERLFAVKVVSSSILSDKQHGCFIREEIAIHSLLHHKNIVNFKKAFTENLSLYIVLELCSNGSLKQLMKQRNQLSLVETKYMLKHILTGVKYLHDKDIVHGDLKLENIFLSSRMIPKIGDFGLSTLISYEEDLLTDYCGTMNYMAPEIISHGGHSFAVDIWAVGCILYKMISGKLPFETHSQNVKEKILSCDFDPHHPGLRKKISNFIMKILNKHPRKRPSAEDLLQDEFLSNSFIPSLLPVSCLWEAPMHRDLFSRTHGSNSKCRKLKRNPITRKGRSIVKKIGKNKKLSKLGRNLHKRIVKPDRFAVKNH
ncbi:hypothetical protein LSTR_LSTR002838 [Laodelphax striatellus]|uniref:Protein kinase domain-containing protein n=1 Tax=Laodelphax striatellus TaxID=195883 RepID=A0A482XH85_LAOST|nr:hypothetical protein LSTR_LSTR002838 [Laodelphax striatellus]